MPEPIEAPTGPTRTEEHRINAEELVARVKELIKEGNARRIIIKGENGSSLLEIPLTAGVVGAFLVPAMVALGAIAALAAHYTIVVEREGAK